MEVETEEICYKKYTTSSFEHFLLLHLVSSLQSAPQL